MILQFILFLFLSPLHGFPSSSSYSPTNIESNEQEQVSMGFGLTPFGIPRGSLMRNAAQAQALTLKAHADFYKQLATAKLRHDMALAKARTASIGNFRLPFKPSLLGSESNMKKEDFDDLKNLDFSNGGYDDFKGLDLSELQGTDGLDFGLDYANRNFDLGDDEYGEFEKLKTKSYDSDNEDYGAPEIDDIYQAINKYDDTRKRFGSISDTSKNQYDDTDLPKRRNEDTRNFPKKPIIVNPRYGLNNPRFINFDRKTSKYLDEESGENIFSPKTEEDDNNKKSRNNKDYFPSKLPDYLVNKREIDNEESRKNHHHHNGNMHRDEELYVWSLNWQNNLERSNYKPNTDQTQGTTIKEKSHLGEVKNTFLRPDQIPFLIPGINNMDDTMNIGNIKNAQPNRIEDSFTMNTPNIPNNIKTEIRRSIYRPPDFNLSINNASKSQDNDTTKTDAQLQSCDNELGCYLVSIYGTPEFWDNYIIDDNIKLDGFEKVQLPRDNETDNTKYVMTIKEKADKIEVKDSNSTKLRESKSDPRHFNHKLFHHKLFNNENRVPQQFWGLRPTHVTINNQQNSFGNTNTGGNIQIAQTTGNSASSQAASRQNNENNVLSSPQLFRFPSNHRVYKRSLPLIKLIADPNAKLDMPKTIENVGTIARNSFEDKRAPMYHLKNLVGSAKNAFLSTLKIVPQDLIIPSQYKIIDKKEDELPETPLTNILRSTNNIIKENNVQTPIRPLTLREKLEKFRLERERRLGIPKINEGLLKKVAFNKPSISNKINNIQDPGGNEIVGRSNTNNIREDPFNFLGTFQKLGTIMRDSVNSGKDTLNHVTDAAHSARKAWHTARFSAPRVLLPYRKAAVFQKPEKVMMITPRFLDVAQDDHKKQEFKDFVGVGHIMDAFGISNPNNNRVNYQKTTIHRGSGPKLMSRFGDDEGDDGSENIITPSKEKLYIVSENLNQNDLDREFLDDAWSSLQKIKEIVGVNTIGEFLDTMEKDFSSIRDKHKTSTPNLSSRFGESNEEELDGFLKELFTEKRDEEIVGIGLNLPPNLLKPFMNQPSNDDLSEYLKENGDSVEEQDFFKKDDDLLLLSPPNASTVDGNEDLRGSNLNVTDEDLRTSMHFHKSLLQPYLGKVDVSDEYDYHPYGNYMEVPYDEK